MAVWFSPVFLSDTQAIIDVPHATTTRTLFSSSSNAAQPTHPSNSISSPLTMSTHEMKEGSIKLLLDAPRDFALNFRNLHMWHALK